MSKKEEVEYASFLTRVCAYIVDMFIVALVASLIALPFTNSTNTEKLDKQLTEVMEQASTGKIDTQTYINELMPLVYQKDRANGVYTIIVVILSIAYFVVYQYYTKQTFGKKMFRIKLEANKGELTMNQMVIRGMIINNIIFSLIALIFVTFSGEGTYFMANMTLNCLYYLIVLVASFMIIGRKDNRGLHDLVCNTKVVKC